MNYLKTRAACAMIVAVGLSGEVCGQASDALSPRPGEAPEAFADRLMQTFGGDERSRGTGLDRGSYTYDWGVAVDTPPPPPGGANSFAFPVTYADLDGNIFVFGTLFTWPDAGCQFLGCPRDDNAMMIRIDGNSNADPAYPYEDITLYDEDTLTSVHTVVADDNGFVYLIGAAQPNGSTNESVAAKLTPDGSMIWRTLLFGIPNVPPTGLVVGPDGVPFVLDAGRISRLNPFTGGVEWFTPSDYVGPLGADRRGNLYAMESGLVVTQLSGETGAERWSVDLSTEIVEVGGGLKFLFDLDGNVFLVGTTRSLPGGGTPTGGFIAKMSRDGELLWVREENVGSSEDRRFAAATIDQNGDIFIAGFNVLGAWALKYDGATGTKLADRTFYGAGGSNFDLVNRSANITLDRIGNVYMYSKHNAEAVLTKLENDDLATIWEFTSGAAPFLVPRTLIVDGGGRIFQLNSYSDGSSALAMRRFTQPLASPMDFADCADIATENQSIWAPGAGYLVEEDVFWEECWGPSPPCDSGDPSGDFSTEGYFTIPIPFTDGLEFGGGLSVASTGAFQLGYRAEIDGGTADVHLPIDITWSIGEESGKPIAQGSMIEITSDWTADPAARLTSCFDPSFNAGLTAGLEFTLMVDVILRAFSEDLVNSNLVNIGWAWPLDYVPLLNLVDILAYFGFPQTGEWYTAEDPLGLFEVGFKTPKLIAESTFDGEDRSFSTTATDDVLSLEARVSEIIHSIADELTPAPLPPISWEYAQSDEVSSFEASYAILQLLALCDLRARQNIDVGVDVNVRYELSNGVTIAARPLDDNDPPASFEMPAGSVTITPFVSADLHYENTTEALIVPGIAWETMRLAASAEAGPYNLFNFDECFLCVPPLDIVVVPLELYNNTWTVSLPEVELAPLRISTEVSNTPALVAASRESLGMLIYNQTSPTVADFNLAANGRTRIIIHGSGFFTNPEVVISHHGRTETIVTEKLNSNTLRIDLPNRFRLLPGVARLWVQTVEGVSNSIDLPIEMPFPRLDTVNPNIWAADPDLNLLPVQVIDGRTFLGGDTFIARRDYFVKMRDDLWNFTTAFGVPDGETADGYFPCFNFNAIPPFPSVVMRYPGGDWTPLPRYVQSVDSGIHNVRLAQKNYDSPGVIDIQIRNPGPGGGVSDIRQLNIGAPIPVVASVSPDFIDRDIPLPPGRTSLVLTVRGPTHVPTFFGYEEPKYGNFNAASVVRFNGIDLPTRFVSSAELRAEVPLGLIHHANDNVMVTVFTPDNGSVYFEQTWYDANQNGQIDYDDPAEIAQQGLVPSGGESAPHLIEIGYTPPYLASISPAATPAQAYAFSEGTSNVKNFANFSVRGSDFREGAVVLIDGQARETTWISRSILNARLLPQDVAAMGQRMITVLNPGERAEESNPMILTVTEPEPEPKSRRRALTGGMSR